MTEHPPAEPPPAEQPSPEHPPPGHLLLERALRSEQFVLVRRRVFRQLLESLLYEGVLTARLLDGGMRYVVDGINERGDPAGYSFTMRRCHGFDRIRLGAEPVLRTVRGHTAEADSLTRFLAETRALLGAEPDRVAGFARELEETLVKDAVAQYVRAERAEALHGASYDELESAVIDGHPYHPAYKSRIGFDLDDNLSWGPEFARPVRPLWLAVRRDLATVSAAVRVDEAGLLRRQLGDALDVFRARIEQARVDPADYTLLPVHPWQWREQIVGSYAARLHRREVIVLGEDPHDHVAQQSIRTLSCRGAPERPYLKLALSILNTSTSRILAPHTVRNAARISDWLRRIVDGDPYLRDELRIIVLGEIMGVSVDPPPVSELVRADTYGTLACIWRESVHEFLEHGEQAVPFTGLTARELDGTPLIDPWVRAAGPTRWVAELLAVSVPPLLHLLQAHGVAMESHAQNLVLVHENGRPTRLALRDFHDGVRFSRAQLAAPELCPELLAAPAHHGNRNSFVETEELDQVTDFLLDAFFFINLGELAMFLAELYDLAEIDFWAEVRAVIERYHRRFPELADRFALFEVGKPRLAVEQLTTRRLLPDTELRLHSVPNPLHRNSVAQQANARQPRDRAR